MKHYIEAVTEAGNPRSSAEDRARYGVGVKVFRRLLRMVNKAEAKAGLVRNPRAQPRPQIIIRRVRIRRAPPIAKRARGARAGLQARAADDPDPELPRILERLKKAPAWRLLPASEREWVELTFDNGLTPGGKALIGEIFELAATRRGERPDPGVLWFSGFPVRGLLRRDRHGLWRIEEHDPAGRFGNSLETRGSA
jgi:hypothetical protein